MDYEDGRIDQPFGPLCPASQFEDYPLDLGTRVWKSDTCMYLPTHRFTDSVQNRRKCPLSRSRKEAFESRVYGTLTIATN